MAKTDLQLQAMTAGLVQHFRNIAQTRMHDVPIVNSALDVEAVGFTRNADGCLGILLTPWFLNLVILPCEGDDWTDHALGSEIEQEFASGRYVFHVAGDEQVGRYLSCSLMSPLLDIPDQQTAVAIAHAALMALHDERQRDTTSSTHATEVARRWQAQPADDEEPTASGEQEHTDSDEEALGDIALSRRAFLGGRLFDE